MPSASPSGRTKTDHHGAAQQTVGQAVSGVGLAALVLLPPKTRRGSLVDAASAGTKAIEITCTASSRADCGAIDTAGVHAKFNLVLNAACSNPKAAANPIDAARRTSQGRVIENTASPGPGRARDATGRIPDPPTGSTGPSSDMADTDDKQSAAPRRPSTSANAGAGDAAAPRDDRRGHGCSRGRGRGRGRLRLSNKRRIAHSSHR